jgi:N-acetylglucosamine-6-phosphate deacetylase
MKLDCDVDDAGRMARAVAYLDPEDGWRDLRVAPVSGSRVRLEVGGPSPREPRLEDGEGYVVPAVPVEFHFHGTCETDFSRRGALDLPEIERQAAHEHALYVPTMFLERDGVHKFGELLEEFSARRRRGELPHLLGLALEGPQLGSVGGTPRSTNWSPGRAEWELLARGAEHGLQYVVCSPGPDSDWVVPLLLEAGIRPALGHFGRDDSATTVRALRRILDLAGRSGAASRYSLLTDHLFNDTPIRFRHAWRTVEEHARRDGEVAALRLPEWTIDTIASRVGDVAGLLIAAAAEGRLTLCLNFDGEHVDRAICGRMVDLVGSDAIICMTDRTDCAQLADQRLHRRDGTELWYQDDGLVAAGSQPIDRQVANMRRWGISERDIWNLVSWVPMAALRPDDHEVARELSYVDAGCRRPLVPTR